MSHVNRKLWSCEWWVLILRYHTSTEIRTHILRGMLSAAFKVIRLFFWIWKILFFGGNSKVLCCIPFVTIAFQRQMIDWPLPNDFTHQPFQNGKRPKWASVTSDPLKVRNDVTSIAVTNDIPFVVLLGIITSFLIMNVCSENKSAETEDVSSLLCGSRKYFSQPFQNFEVGLNPLRICWDHPPNE